MSGKTYLRRCAVLFLFLALFCLFHLDTILMSEKAEYEVYEEMVFLLLGVTRGGTGITVLSLIHKMILPIGMALFFSDFIVKNKNADNMYFFLRYSDRKAWLKAKSRDTLVWSLLFAGSYYAAHCIVAVHVCEKTENAEEAARILMLGILFCLFLEYHILAANWFRLRLREDRVFLAIFAHFSAEIVCGYAGIGTYVNPFFVLLNAWKKSLKSMGFCIIYLLILCIFVLWGIRRHISVMDIGMD